ncbi:MAG: DUF192 domain-containing protein [Verrucomicrobia bacterium]|nr:DUF192 domain-containing protein [Verrucomicrobiota bacterium]
MGTGLWKSGGCLLLIAAALAGGCRRPATAARVEEGPSQRHWYLDRAQPPLPTIPLWVGAETLTAEVARTTTQIATGMMYRTNMAENAAMLFVFRGPAKRSFYMRNTKIPLSVAYLDPEGYILEIYDMQPMDETPVESVSSNVQYALETRQGWFKRRGIGPGALVRAPFGGLNEVDWRTLRPLR